MKSFNFIPVNLEKIHGFLEQLLELLGRDCDANPIKVESCSPQVTKISVCLESAGVQEQGFLVESYNPTDLSSVSRRLESLDGSDVTASHTVVSCASEGVGTIISSVKSCIQ